MSSKISTNLKNIRHQIPDHVKLIAVSKTKPVNQLLEAFDAGQRAFGENYVQEMCDKQKQLPDSIEWHFIGHLQRNKVKNIAPFVHWIHAVDSERLFAEINQAAEKNERTINCLLQIHIAKEESKFGFSASEVKAFASAMQDQASHSARICGVMGMASFTDDMSLVSTEFKELKRIFDELKNGVFSKHEHFCEISMGMSSDWQIAVEEGSTMVRIGSAIFGAR